MPFETTGTFKWLVKGTEGVIAYFPGCNLGCLVNTEHVCSRLPKQLQVYRHSLENGHKKMYKNLNHGIKKGNHLNVHQWNGRMEDYTHVPDRMLYGSTRCVCYPHGQIGKTYC